MNNKHNSLQTRRTPFGGMLFAILMLFGISQTAFAQVTTNSGSGLAPTYASLNLAITALNAATITAPVIITLTANETAPIGGYSITAQGTATNTIIIQGSVSAGTITASPALVVGVVTDAIFKLIGADFVTIRTLTMQENAVNTIGTAASNNMTEWGVALLYASATNGAQNNTIQNNGIFLNRIYSNTFGIYSNVRHTATVPDIAADITAPTGANSNNKVYGNTISNVNDGVVFIGANLAANMDSGNDIGGTAAATGNTLTNYGAGSPLTPYVGVNINSIGIHTSHQLGINTSFNTLTSANVIGTTLIYGILNSYPGAQPAGSFTLNITNNTVTILNASLSGGTVCINSQGINPAQAGVTANLSNNTIQNCVLSGVATSAFLNCISNSAGVGILQMNNNIIRGNTSTATTGGFVGVACTTNGVITTSSISNNQIGTATSPAITFSDAMSGPVTCIAHNAAANTAASTVTGNDIRGVVHSVTGSSNHNYISCGGTPLTMTVSNNTFTNIVANTTGDVNFVLHNYTMPANGTQTFNNNNIVTGFNKTGAGGVVTGFVSGVALSPSTSTSTITNNNLSNITVTNGATIFGINNSDGNATSSPNRVITDNTFSNWTGSTFGSYVGINFFRAGTSCNISRNTITNYNAGSNVTGINIGNGFTGGNLLTISNNTISGLVATGINSFTQGLITGSASSTVNVTGNTITGFSSAGIGTRGLVVSAGTVVNVSKNKIGDISHSSTNAIIVGMIITDGTTINVTNNLIGDLRASATNNTNDAVRGITVASSTALSNINMYFNTVNIGGTSSGANFSSTAIFHTTSATATTATLDMRNNIFVNSGIATGTGNCVAYRRSSADLTNFATTSNKNSFFAPIIFADGTNTDATLAAYKTRVGAVAEANSISTNPTFLSTTASSATFLRINTVSPSLLESAGANITGITDDVDGDIRQGNAGYAGTGTAPDIGADEFGIAIPCPSINFTNTTVVSPNAVVGTAYSLNGGATASSGTLVYVVAPALPAGLTINATTGLISGTATATAVSATYTVTASTSTTCTATQTYTFAITVASTCTTATTPTLTLSPVVASAGTLVRGTVGVPYSQQFTGTGVTGTYTYAISFPTALLPDGINFNAATGLLSGTPNISTSVTFIVTANVGGCPSVPVSYSLVINPAVATAIDNSLASQVKVSPNPSLGVFNVDFGSINMVKSSVRVYDAQGKTVFTADNNNNLMTISLDKFAAGIYLLEVETSKGRILKRLAKQ